MLRCLANPKSIAIAVESAPNHDAVGLRVANDELAQSIYTSMTSIEGLRPCDFTIPNFPDCKIVVMFSRFVALSISLI